MGLARNTGVALAAAGALALGGTAAAGPPTDTTAPVTPGRAGTGWADGVLDLGGNGVLDLDDTHRVAGEDGTVRWEFTPPWDTTELPEGGSVRWSLTGAEGPGTVTVHGTEEGRPHGAPAVWFDSSDGLPDVSALPAGARGLSRWAFSAPGVYRLALAAQAEPEAEAEPAATATAALTVRVGGTAPAPAPSPSVPASVSPSASASTPVEVPPAPGERSSAPRLSAAVAPVREAATERTVLDEGHVDIAARVVAGRLQIQVKDGTVPGRAVWREPSSLVLRVKPEARRSVPAHPDFAFLGKAGAPVWLLDQVQRPGLLWPGWSTDNMAAGATRGEIAFSLVKAEGPGPFALFTYDGLSGASVRFASADGVPDTFGVPQNTHAHGGWAFGAEGTYRLTLTMSGLLADGTRTSDTETLTFEVGSGAGRPDTGTSASTGTSSGSGSASASGSVSDSGSGSGSASGASSGGSVTGGPEAEGTATTGTAGTPATTGTPDTTATPEGPATSGPRGSMAATGAGSTVLSAGAAAALAVLGAGAVLFARRRRRA
ncbi:choice-of-anchor M domain-containing protein [Streptomyces sp. NPDC059695]|uniref:choice-of-anchor M domain-containing protein n=1 Tax=Streptomyces sp. NPDC059695 TaxID=3346910 RepID=UPI0036AC8A43